MKVLLKFIFLLCLSDTVRVEYYGDHVLFGVNMIRQTVDMQSNTNGVVSEVSEAGNAEPEEQQVELPNSFNSNSLLLKQRW